VIGGFHHFGLTCADADRSIAFYRDVFGMTLVADRQVERGGFVADVTGIEGARVRIVHLSGYGVNLEFLEFSEPEGEPRPRELNHTGSAHTCFVTDDLEAECARLLALGVKVRSKDRRPVSVVGGPNDGGKGLYVEDPDGIPIEIIQLARPWPGALSHNDDQEGSLCERSESESA
jgi:catechol 2,3-dioxygenase-like lactoylglutathione lyase family enzyme